MAQSGARRLWIGWLGVVLAPGLVLLDTGIAVLGGWSPASAGGVGKLAYVAPAIIVLAMTAMLFRSGRQMLRNYTWQLVLLSVSLVASCLLAQQVVRLVQPTAAFHCRPPHAKYRFAPSAYLMPGVDGRATSSINSLGLRGSEPPDRSAAYRILCLGGSTTECCYLNGDECWPAQLGAHWQSANHARAWVASAGHGDYASGHHLWFVRESPRVDEMDCLVVLMGVNDLVRHVLGLDAGGRPGPLWSRSPSLENLQQLWNVSLGKGYVCDVTGERWLLMRLVRDIRPPAAAVRWDAELDVYARRITEMATAARERGVRIVFVTHPALWADFLTHSGYRRLVLGRAVPYPREWDLLSADRLRAILDRYNDRLATTCRSHQIELVDAAAELSGHERYFYDDFHLNEAGCRALGLLLTRWFAAHTTNR